MRTRAVIVTLTLALSASASTSTYTLRWGDTLARVARKLGVDVATLVSTNDIKNPHAVREGMVLNLPERTYLHTVKRGDTLASIARWYGTSVSDVKGRNGLKKGTIRVGQRLTVPLPAGLAAAPAPVQAPALKPISVTPGMHVHTVKKGDTVADIAKFYGTSPGTVRSLNGLKSNKLQLGQQLTVPLPPTPDASTFQGLCPVKGARHYDFSDSWGSPRHGGRRHKGNDIFAKRGTPVIANVGGSLRYAPGSIAGNAYYLAGEDGHTYYGAHLDKIIVKEGHVDRGQVIGFVGSTGNAAGTPSHLHFEIKPHGGPSVDPHPILTKWCP